MSNELQIILWSMIILTIVLMGGIRCLKKINIQKYRPSQKAEEVSYKVPINRCASSTQTNVTSVKVQAKKDTGVALNVNGSTESVQSAKVQEKKYYEIWVLMYAYGPCIKCCKRWWRYRTPAYDKRRLMPNDKVVATNGELPIGAKVFVPGYGYARVLDRGTKNDVFFYDRRDGAGIKKYYYWSHKRALKWGKQWKKVRVYYGANKSESN